MILRVKPLKQSCRLEHAKTKQNKAKQNTTKQTETKEQTKQNKTKTPLKKKKGLSHNNYTMNTANVLFCLAFVFHTVDTGT